MHVCIYLFQAISSCNNGCNLYIYFPILHITLNVYLCYKTLHLILLTCKDISRHQKILTVPLFIAQNSCVWFYFTFFHGFSRGSLNWFTGLNGGFIFQPWGFYMWMCIHKASVEYSHMKQARYEEHYTFKKGFP